MFCFHFVFVVWGHSLASLRSSPQSFYSTFDYVSSKRKHTNAPVCHVAIRIYIHELVQVSYASSLRPY